MSRHAVPKGIDMDKINKLLADMPDDDDDDGTDFDDSELEAQIAEIEGRRAAPQGRGGRSPRPPPRGHGAGAGQPADVDSALRQAQALLSSMGADDDDDDDAEPDGPELTDAQLEAIVSGKANLEDIGRKRGGKRSSAASSSSSSPSKGRDFEKDILVVQNLRLQFESAAKESHNAGDDTNATYCLKVCRELESIIEMLKARKPFDMRRLPKPPKPAAAAESADPEARKYTLMIKHMEKQIDTCNEFAKRYSDVGDVKSAEKLEGQAKKFKMDLDDILASRAEGRPAPAFSLKTYQFPFVRYNYDVQPNKLHVQVPRCLGIVPPKGVREKDLCIFVVAKFKPPGASEEQVHKTGRVSGTSCPQFKDTLKFKVEGSRLEQRMQRAKLVLEVMHHTSSFFSSKDDKLAELSVPLSQLVDHCELRVCETVQHPSRRNKELDWKMEVKISVRQALSGKEDRILEEVKLMQLAPWTASKPVGPTQLQQSKVLAQTEDVLSRTDAATAKMKHGHRSASSLAPGHGNAGGSVGTQSLPPGNQKQAASSLTLPSYSEYESIEALKHRFKQVSSLLNAYEQKQQAGHNATPQIKKLKSERVQIQQQVEKIEASLGDKSPARWREYMQRVESCMTDFKSRAAALKANNQINAAKAVFTMYKCMEKELEALQTKVPGSSGATTSGQPSHAVTSAAASDTHTPSAVPQDRAPAGGQSEKKAEEATPQPPPRQNPPSQQVNVEVPKISEIPSHTALEALSAELSEDIQPYQGAILANQPLPPEVKGKIKKMSAIKKRMNEIGSQLNPEDMDGIKQYLQNVKDAAQDYQRRAQAFKAADRMDEATYVAKIVGFMQKEVQMFEEQLGLAQ